MASLAEIQRLLRQQRAGGKAVTSGTEKRAFEAFFDVQANKNLQKGQLALERKQVENQASQFGEELAITKQGIENEEGAATIKGITDLGTLGFEAAQTDIGKSAIGKVGSLFSPKPALASEAALFDFGGVGSTGTPAVTGAQTSSAPAIFDFGGVGSTGTTATPSAGGGIGVAGTVGGIAAAVALDDILSRKVAGTEDDPAASFAQKTRGITRFGGATPLQTALFEKGLGEGGVEIFDKITDPTGLSRKAEDAVGKFMSATVPKILGGGGSTGNSTLDKVLNPIGTWLCTKTKETVGMEKDEWELMGQFRKYAYKNHKDWIDFYVDIGPDLIEKINGDEAFYKNLKETFILPVVGLVKGGFLEAAYLSYKSACIQLVEKYNPAIMDGAPEVNNG